MGSVIQTGWHEQKTQLQHRGAQVSKMQLELVNRSMIHHVGMRGIQVCGTESTLCRGVMAAKHLSNELFNHLSRNHGVWVVGHVVVLAKKARRLRNSTE